MVSLAAAAQGIEPDNGPPPWPGHDYIRGYTVTSMPTTTGDVLALGVFPDNDYAPYRTIWHRSPTGAWSIFVDADDPSTTCSRFFGPGAREILLASIEVSWSDDRSLEVSADPAARPSWGPAPGHVRGDGRPRLRWRMSLAEPPAVRGMNLAGRAMPEATWRSPLFLRQREWMAQHLLGMGAVRFTATTPSGHHSTACPERIAFIDDAQASLDGRDLGAPTRSPTTPLLGEVTLPARPTFAISRTFFRSAAADPGKLPEGAASQLSGDGARTRGGPYG